ncbi:hypothetical protein P9112_007748 [Eukaryota sp. TZLM1-RC]
MIETFTITIYRWTITRNISCLLSLRGHPFSFFDNPTQYHSRLDFVLQDKVLEIIDYSDGRQGFVNANRSPDDLPTYFLPSSRFHLPTSREIFELHPAVFDHPRFLRSQFKSVDDEYDRKFSFVSAMIEISSESDPHLVASLVHSLSESSPVPTWNWRLGTGLGNPLGPLLFCIVIQKYVVTIIL